MIDVVPAITLSGHAKIELFDAVTRKKVTETEGHNLFTNYGLERFRRLSHLLIGGQFGANAYFSESDAQAEASNCLANDANFGFMKYLYLSSNTAPVSAAATTIPGTVTGYATREPYTGTDVLRGSVNQNETILIPGAFKAVFDFGTDKANGTHGSVFWTAFHHSRAGDGLWSFERYGSTAQLLARGYSRIAEGTDGYLYGLVKNILYKIDPISLSEIATYPLTPQSTGKVFDVVDGVCYYTDSSTLYKLNLATGTTTSLSLPSPSVSGTGCVINGYLYYSFNTAQNIAKINVSTGVFTYKTLPFPSYSIYRKGSSLYLNESLLYAYDFDINVATPVGPGMGGNTGLGNVTTLNEFLTLYGAQTYYYGTQNAYRYLLYRTAPEKGNGNLITAKVLDAPVTKSNTQTMKVTYTISIT